MQPASAGVSRHAELALGALFAALALTTLLAWIPADVETGILEKVRRRERLGDAFFPSMVAIAMLAVAACHLLGTLAFRNRTRVAAQARSQGSTLHFVLLASSIVALALTLIVFAGPALVATFEPTLSYRELRDSVPYKYAGFAGGGVALVAGLVVMLEGHLRAGALITAVVAVATLIAFYDLPFEDLLLPPNGDQ